VKNDVLSNDVVLTDKRCVLPIAKQLRCRVATDKMLVLLAVIYLP